MASSMVKEHIPTRELTMVNLFFDEILYFVFSNNTKQIVNKSSPPMDYIPFHDFEAFFIACLRVMLAPPALLVAIT
jgi:hypothetical protein